jgi:CHAT domain-containing protein/Tfp pilus assembly protein PilF
MDIPMSLNKNGKFTLKVTRLTIWLRHIGVCAIFLTLIFGLYPQAEASGLSDESSEDGLTPPEDWENILQDPFNDNRYDWSLGVDDNQWRLSDRQIKNGVFRWEAEAHQGFYWYAHPDHASLGDFYLSVDIRKISGPDDADYGVVFRVDENDNLYYFEIYDPGQYTLWRKSDGEWYELIGWRSSEAIHARQFNRIEVLAVGPEFSFAINGQKVSTTNDDYLEKGKIGLLIEMDQDDTRAVFEFDNLEIWSPVTDVVTDEGETGDLEARISELETDLMEYRQSVDKANEGKTLNNLGHLYHERGDSQLAIETLQQAIGVYESIGENWKTAYPLDGLGMVYRSMGEYQKSIKYYSQTLEIVQEKIINKEWEASILHNLGSAHEDLGKNASAIDYLEQSLKLWREIGNIEKQAWVINAIGWNQHMLGGDEKAAVNLVEAMDLFRQISDLYGEAWVLGNLGRVYEDLSEYAKAADYTQQAVELWRSVGDRREEAWALNNLGYYLSFLFDYTTAMDSLQRARKIFQDLGDLSGEGWVLDNMAYVTSYNLGYDDGMAYQLEALDVYQELGNNSRLAECLNALGRYSTNIGDYEVAMGYFQRAGEVWHQLGDRRNEARAVNNIGVIYAYLGDRERAMEYYQDALEMNIMTGYHWGEATMRSNLGEGYLLLDNPVTALEYCQRAKVIFEAINHRNKFYEAANLNCLGRAYQEMGDYEQAETYILEGLEMMIMDGSPYGITIIKTDLGGLYNEAGEYDQALEVLDQVLQLWRKNGDPEGESRTLTLIGKVYEALGEKDSALDAYLGSIALVESILGRVKAESFQTSMAAKEVDVYQLAIQVLIEMERYDEAFMLSERSRARNFLDAMGKKRPDIRESSNLILVQKEEDVHTKISVLEAALFNEKSKPTEQQNPDLINDLQSQLTTIQQDYVDLIAEIQINNPELASLVTIDALSVTGIQDLLNDQITLVAYYLTESSPLAFVISKNAFQVIVIPVETSKITAAVESFRALGLANLGNPYPRSLEDLYTWLVAPLKPYLNTLQVGIIPHQSLHYVPFTALYDGAHYFSEQYTLFQLPSASSLPFIQQKTGHELTNPLVMGDPDTRNPDLPSLDYAAKEAERIAALYTVQPLLSSQASEHALRESSPGNGIIHIAAHGGLNPRTPMFSRLWLAPGGDDDGQLNVYEVYGLDLAQTDLIVLSACQTQHGEVSAGDEIISLNRAFLYGSPTVISSLWSVDDQATGELMDHFYTHLRDGMKKAQALQAAQDEIRNNPDHPEWRHPYYWAAFVLNGDPGELDEVLPHTEKVVLDTAKVIPQPIDQQPGSLDRQKNNLAFVILAGIGVLVLIAVLGIVITRSIRKNP